jgi:hypothetical protein
VLAPDANVIYLDSDGTAGIGFPDDTIRESEASKDLTEVELTDKPTVSSLHPDIKNANKRAVEINIK